MSWLAAARKRVFEALASSASALPEAGKTPTVSRMSEGFTDSKVSDASRHSPLMKTW